jgi:hypothetical protein
VSFKSNDTELKNYCVSEERRGHSLHLSHFTLRVLKFLENNSIPIHEHCIRIPGAIILAEEKPYPLIARQIGLLF